MTRQEYETAKRLAAIEYRIAASADLELAKTKRATNNAKRRIELINKLVSIWGDRSSTFWTAENERAYKMIYTDAAPDYPVSPF